MEDQGANIRMGFANVQGLKKAMSEGEIFELMYNFDLLGVGETWLKEGEEIKLRDFMFIGKERIKTGKRGHQPGGIGVIINKSIQNKIKVEETTLEEVLWVIYSNIKDKVLLVIGIIYKQPVGSKYFNERFYERLEEELRRIKKKFRNYLVCLIGDFNARVGKMEPYINTEAFSNEYERDRYVTSKRESKDEIVNSEGIKLLEFCSTNNLIIVNGTVEGDMKGEFTFVNKLGKSVIDFFCVECNLIHMVRKFKISELGCSDHMLLNVEMRERCDNERRLDQVKKEVRRDIKYIIWKDENEQEFVNKVNDEVSRLLRIGIQVNVENEKLEEAIELFYKIVRRGGSEERKHKQEKWDNSKWFDEECENHRKKLREKFNEWKKGNDEESRKEYVEIKNQYRNILNKKREMYNNKQSVKINQMLKDNNSKGIWKYINKNVGCKRGDYMRMCICI